jgi:glycosyltransferase involved in cell wall biosynthesis
MKRLKVLNLATSLSGGAGIAARRTHESLIDAGVDSNLLVVKSLEVITDSKIRKVRNSKFSNLLSRANTILQRRVIQNSSRLVTPISIGTLSEKDIKLYNPNVIHIHAYYNLLTTKAIWKLGQQFPNSGIAITLHDERLFTGGCHYTGGCNKFESECKKCPQVSTIGSQIVHKSHTLALKEKQEMYKIITPSVWLANQAHRSSILKNNPVYTLSNPVPQIFFDQYSKTRTSSEYNVAFISQDLDNPYKGINTVLEAISKLDSMTPSGKIIMNFVGRGKLLIETKKIEIRSISIDSEKTMAEFLGRMNLVILASTEDNMPNVILESLAAGVRVIGTNIGGIREVLKDFSLDVYEPGDSASLSLLILKESSSKFQKPNQLNTFSFRYSNVARKLIEIYSK